MGESGKPIDTSKNSLIYLFLERKIRVERINRRDQFNWVTRAIRSHIRDLVYCVDRKAISGEFCER